MKKILFGALLLLGLSACSLGRTPLINTAEVSKVDFSNTKSFKEGSDCAWTVLFFGPFGTEQIMNAVKQANISKVEVVDYSYTSYLLASKGCVKVYGH